MMMPIDGSVDDAHTILGVEELNHLPHYFKEYIQKEQLNCWRFNGNLDYSGHPIFGWVFWSQLDNFADKISLPLQKLIGVFTKELDFCLVQFWAPTKTSEGRTLLTTQFQPFALGPTYDSVARYWRTLLCEYRMGMCREYNSFYADAECAQEQLGLPGRVFLNQLPESIPEVEHYTLKEYPQRDLALRCTIHSSWAEPVFDHSSHTCVGVLEIVSPCYMARVWHDKSFLGKMYDIFQEFGLLCFDEHKHYEMQIGDKNKASAFQELKTVFETVCKIHELPLAMTWVPCSACNNLLQGQLLSRAVKFFGHGNFYRSMFAEVSKLRHLRKGGVARMLLSSPNMMYCSDITQLSLAEYPMVPYARQCNLRGWFTICLQSNYTANDIYVLEFFLPRSSDNSWTSLSLILGTMEENFSTFKLASGQELGDLLSVEVMDFQNGEKLHFIQKIRAKDGGEMLQLGHLDQPPMDAISNGVNVISEAQNYNLASLEPLLSGIFPTQLNSSNQLSIDQSRNAHNVVIAEQNILVVPTSKEHKRKMQDRKHKKAGVKIEVSLEEILKCSNMKRKYAARELKVSISTFKRVCRGYHIHRWPPRNIENANPFQPSPVENQRQIPQLNSDLPSNQALVGVSHIKPGFQDANMVTIRAKYENNNIKFRLPLSSRFVELREEVAKRLNIEAGTYYVKYKDEEDELILIACDEDLQDCMHTSRSLGKTSVVVLLELKQPITNLNPGLSVGQQTLFSPLRGQGLQSAEGELSNVPPVHNMGGVWLDAHFSYTPTIEEEETINKCMQDGSFWGEFVDGCWISNITVIEYIEMLDYYLPHCHFFCPNVIKNFKQNGRMLNKILLPKTEKIFFPILRGRHWMLLVIDVKKKKFLWLDSMRRETEKKYSENFAHFLNHDFVFEILREQNEWPIEYPENTPIQENGYDCGVYIMAFMISLAVGDKLPQLSQAQVQKMRRTICLELEKWDIIPQCPLVDYKFLCIQERKKNEALNEKLRMESTAALRDEVFIVSERRKHVKWADQVVERGKDN